MNGLILTILLAVSSVAIAQPPVAPASAAANASAQKALLAAFQSADALKRSRIYGDAVAIGPRLWAATREARKQFQTGTKDIFAVIPSRRIVEEWKLEALDPATLPEGLRAVVLEAAKQGTPVLAGAVFQRSSEVVPLLLLAGGAAEDFPFAVRKPTNAELEYYYSLIPYELSEPLWVVQGKVHSFLCHFDPSERAFYVELL